ncbi:MAG: hypothetical protein Q8942_10075 [Bacillota bacterium]|nr:hypothetical protein [Bacillota bacterium]
MLAILYLLLSWFTGYCILERTFPWIFKISEQGTLFGKKIRELSSWFITLPAAFLVGNLFSTWINYILSYLFHYISKSPLFFGNIVTFIYLIGLSAYFILRKNTYKDKIEALRNNDKSSIKSFLLNHKLEIGLITGLTVFYWFLFYGYMWISNGNIVMGSAQVKDLEFHVALARSFSHGSNFPTEYPYFPNGRMDYHFLFQFLVGNLEFLGMRLDYAFNIMSTVTMVGFLMLLFSLTIVITGRRWAGFLTVMFFIFRSSFAIFTFGRTFKSIGQLFSGIIHSEKFIGQTPCEWWGIYTQNVYMGQRHFAFSLGIMTFALILVFPLFRKAMRALKQVDQTRIVEEGEEGEEKYIPLTFKTKMKLYFSELFLKKDAWLPRNIKASAITGLILGLIGFWNGAVLMALLCILFIIAIVSKHKLEFLNIASIAALLMLIQYMFFMGVSNQGLSPKVYIGFLAEKPELFSILKYYLEVLGFMPFVLLLGTIVGPKGSKWLALAFVVPIVLATTMQFTVSVPGFNHKLVNLSIALLNIFPAYGLYKLIVNKRKALRCVAVVFIFLMIATGIVDICTVYNLSNFKKPVSEAESTPLMQWIDKNTDKNAVFLTQTYDYVHPVVSAGRKIFFGSTNFAGIAGYNIDERDAIYKKILSAKDDAETRKLIKEYKINYILIDKELENIPEFNEKYFEGNFEMKYSDNDNKVYKLQ